MQQKINPISLLVFLLLFVLPVESVIARDTTKPSLMLARIYHKGINLDNYWVSEKLDGVRAYWDGQRLISRGGNIYHAPNWFIDNFPKQKLDGELWIGRHKFEQVVSTVRDKIPDENAWKAVKFMVFDMPELNSIFDDRLLHMKTIINQANIPWLQLVRQWRVDNHAALMAQLEQYVDSGAEGLMLHRGASHYNAKRSNDLLKVKSYQDAEAVVIQHIPGKGKYFGMLGALLVETRDGVRFKLGSGFSDKQRQNPPPIGSTITYQFPGKTNKGVPRFASFLRVRPIENE